MLAALLSCFDISNDFCQQNNKSEDQKSIEHSQQTESSTNSTDRAVLVDEEAKKLVATLTGVKGQSEEEEPARPIKSEGANGEEDDASKEIIRKSARLVGSLSDAEFQIAFNTDLFQDHVKHADGDVGLFAFPFFV